MKNIHESVSKLLNNKLDKYKSKNLDSSTCTEIYTDIFDTFVTLFEESKAPLSNESVNLISQMYYDSITVNSNQELDPNIFNQRASTKSVETKELALLATMFNKTPFASVFISEIKRRS